MFKFNFDVDVDEDVDASLGETMAHPPSTSRADPNLNVRAKSLKPSTEIALDSLVNTFLSRRLTQLLT